jgi:hypothetical protein
MEDGPPERFIAAPVAVLPMGASEVTWARALVGRAAANQYVRACRQKAYRRQRAAAAQRAASSTITRTIASTVSVTQ